MGQKIHPYGLRLGIITDWKSRWYSEKDYALQVNEDHQIRKYLRGELKRGAVSRIDIERLGDKKVQIDIHTGRPGVVIGRGGSEADRLRAGLEDLTNRQVKFNVIEVSNPELDATLLARSVADQLEGRVAFRRAMKRAVSTALKAGAEGVRIQASGRLGGADMGRREWYLEGRVPLHTLRADVDYGQATAKTSVGAVGIKCWVYKGDMLRTGALRGDKIAAEARLAAGGPSERRPSARSRAEAAAGKKGGKRLIEAGGGKRTVEAGGGKRLIEAGGGKRKGTAADAVAEFEAAREEAEEVVEAVEESREQEVAAEMDTAEEVVATESLPEKAKEDHAVSATSEALAEEAKDIATPEDEKAEVVEESADTASAEAAKDTASEQVAEADSAQGPFRGKEPPEGFVIKGNEDSMLYHRPDSSMYGRTKAEVWFKSEEDAVAAGFKLAGTHPKKRQAASSKPQAEPASELEADEAPERSEGDES
jgi:small subunit ribosomal protein S3